SEIVPRAVGLDADLTQPGDRTSETPVGCDEADPDQRRGGNAMGVQAQGLRARPDAFLLESRTNSPWAGREVGGYARYRRPHEPEPRRADRPRAFPKYRPPGVRLARPLSQV